MAEKSNGQGTATTTASVSKMEAVRQALGQLGKSAMPAKIQGLIKEKFGIDMKLDHISNYKSVLRRGGKKSAPQKSAAQQTAAPKSAAPKAAPATGNGHGGLSVEDVDTVKKLLGRHGPSRLKGLIDVLAH